MQFGSMRTPSPISTKFPMIPLLIVHLDPILVNSPILTEEGKSFRILWDLKIVWFPMEQPRPILT